jgi:hypothetical protein
LHPWRPQLLLPPLGRPQQQQAQQQQAQQQMRSAVQPVLQTSSGLHSEEAGTQQSVHWTEKPL